MKDKYYFLYKMCKKWIQNKQKGISLEKKLDKSNVKKVAIYGWGEIGWLLDTELCKGRIEYIIDRNAQDLIIKYPAFLPTDKLPAVDLVIVTIIDQYEVIKEELLKHNNIPICSIDELVCEERWEI